MRLFNFFFSPFLYFLQPQKHEGQLSVMQLMDMLTGVASGMKYLTEMGFVHKRLAAHKVRNRAVGAGGTQQLRLIASLRQITVCPRTLTTRFLFE